MSTKQQLEDMQQVLIITGPTASGKSDLSEIIAKKIGAEIINADVGQFYRKLSIGTAKPDLTLLPCKAHLFDLIDEPKDISSFEYRLLVIEKIREIQQRGKLPILVGGSLFYIKSLFFPPHDFSQDQAKVPDILLEDFIKQKKEDSSLWDQLCTVDPERAAQLHPNDIYRIKRALTIWLATGIKPSMLQPVFNPVAKALIVSITPDRAALTARINQRIGAMINQGWIDEAKSLVDLRWESFLSTKGLIGYELLINWIKDGEKAEAFDGVIKRIQEETNQYAKRQMTFWRGFEKQLRVQDDKEFSWGSIMNIEHVDESVVQAIINLFRK